MDYQKDMINKKFMEFVKSDNFFRKGFSLVELSIVILIISILTYSVISGGNVVKNAKVVNLVKESDTYIIATEQFIQRYNYLPGDFPDANATFCGNKNCTVDGNGDGYIGSDGDGPTGSESLNFFNHLYLAGLVNKEFNGSYNRTISLSDINETYYPFVNGSKDIFLYISSDSINGSYNRLNRITYGSIKSKDRYGGIPGWLAQQFDCKIDDCNPTTGTVVAKNFKDSKVSYLYDDKIYYALINMANASSTDTDGDCVINGKYNINSNKCTLYQNIYTGETNYYNEGGSGSGGNGSSSSASSKTCNNSKIKHNYASFNANGTTASGARLYGSCNSGYEQEGTPFASCNDGNWSINVRCNPVKCENSKLTVENGNFSINSGTTTYKGKKIANCNIGYTRNGETVTATCEADKNWSYKGSCDIVKCNNSTISPENYDSSIILSGETNYNETVDVKCKIGYTKNGGTIKAKCKDDTAWSYDKNCDIVTCNVSDLSNIYIFSEENSTINYGTSIYGSCAFGYTNDKDLAIAKCDSNGSWNYEKECKLIECENSTLSSNNSSFTSSGTTSPNESIDGKCNKGYTGTVSATCKIQEDGKSYKWEYNNNCSIKTCKVGDLFEAGTSLYGGKEKNNTRKFVVCTNSNCTNTSSREFHISYDSQEIVNYGTYLKISTCAPGYSIKGGKSDRIFKCESATDSTSSAFWKLDKGDNYCMINSGCAEFAPGKSYTLDVSNLTDLKIQLWGASGGGINGGHGGFGYGKIYNSSGDTNTFKKLYIYVGSRGKLGIGGFNGGGSQDKYCTYDSNYSKSYGGGGSTDIRADGTSLSNRIAVVGGGGGSSSERYKGGTGGSLNKNGANGMGDSNIAVEGSGATITSAGVGKSGTNINPGYSGSSLDGGSAGDPNRMRCCGGCGGGGYYGGGGGSSSSFMLGGSSGGGGGSGYIDSRYISILNSYTEVENPYYDGFVRVCWGDNHDCDYGSSKNDYKRKETCSLYGESIESYKTLKSCDYSELKSFKNGSNMYSLGNHLEASGYKASAEIEKYIKNISTRIETGSLTNLAKAKIVCPYNKATSLELSCYDGDFYYEWGYCDNTCSPEYSMVSTWDKQLAEINSPAKGYCTGDNYVGVITASCIETSIEAEVKYSGSCERVCTLEELESRIRDYGRSSAFYPNKNEVMTDGTVYKNKEKTVIGSRSYSTTRYFTNGSMAEATCGNGYTESNEGGEISSEWGTHAYKCEWGTWKRMGGCYRKCSALNGEAWKNKLKTDISDKNPCSCACFQGLKDGDKWEYITEPPINIGHEHNATFSVTIHTKANRGCSKADKEFKTRLNYKCINGVYKLQSTECIDAGGCR